MAEEKNKDCIFCKIAKGEIPCVKIWEDDKHLAFLDGMPNTEGMTLVISKEHYDSDATDMPDKPYQELMLSAKKVAKLLEKGIHKSKNPKIHSFAYMSLIGSSLHNFIDGTIIDEDTPKDKSVTIRDRDSTKQIRVKISELHEVVRKVINGEDLLKLGKLVETRVKGD